MVQQICNANKANTAKTMFPPPKFFEHDDEKFDTMMSTPSPQEIGIPSPQPRPRPDRKNIIP